MNKNIELANLIYRAFGAGNLAAILNILHEDINWEVIGPSEIPYFGRFHGKQEVQRFFSLVAETEDVDYLTPEEFIADGAYVVVLGKEQGRVKATGKMFQTSWSHVWEFAHGKIVRFREYIDPVPILAALHTDK
jgi:uncharacterized protein